MNKITVPEDLDTTQIEAMGFEVVEHSEKKCHAFLKRVFRAGLDIGTSAVHTEVVLLV